MRINRWLYSVGYRAKALGGVGLFIAAAYFGLGSNSEVWAQDQGATQEQSGSSTGTSGDDTDQGQEQGQIRRLVLATGPISGLSYLTGGAICDQINATHDRHGLYCSVQPSDGSEENIRALLAGSVDLGIVQSDWLFFAREGIASFSDTQGGQKLKRLLTLHRQEMAVVAAAELDGDTDAILKSKPINLGPMGSGQRALSEILLAALRLPADELVDVGALAPRPQLEAFCARKIGAFLLPAAHPTRVVEIALGQCKGKLLPVAGRRLAAVVKDNPYLEMSEIRARTYPGQTEAVPTFGLRSYLVASEDLPDQVALEVVRALAERFEDLRRAHSSLNSLTQDAVFSDSRGEGLHRAVRDFLEQDGASN